MMYLKKICYEILRWIDFLFSYIPGNIGIKLRQVYFAKRFKQFGKDITIGIGVKFTGYENIELGSRVNLCDFTSLHVDMNGSIKIGDDFGMNTNSTINASGGGHIHIGNDVMIAQNVVIRAADHGTSDLTNAMNKQGHVPGKIVIGDDCWISANVVVLKDVAIGNHSIVAAGAVITKDVESYSIVGGVPAKLLKKRINKVMHV